MKTRFNPFQSSVPPSAAAAAPVQTSTPRARPKTKNGRRRAEAPKSAAYQEALRRAQNETSLANELSHYLRGLQKPRHSRA